MGKGPHWLNPNLQFIAYYVKDGRIVAVAR